MPYHIKTNSVTSAEALLSRRNFLKVAAAAAAPAITGGFGFLSHAHGESGSPKTMKSSIHCMNRSS